MLDAMLSGWLTDRFFGGRAMRIGLIYVVLAGASVLAFWKVDGQSMLWNTILLWAASFFIYGPQYLIGIAAAKLATKRAAVTAVGLTGLFAYASTVLSGWRLGMLVERYGWNAGFTGLIAIVAVGTLPLALAWPAKAHGYAVEESGTQRLTQLPCSGTGIGSTRLARGEVSASSKVRLYAIRVSMSREQTTSLCLYAWAVVGLL